MNSQYARLFAQATPAPTYDNSALALELSLPWPLSLNRLWRAIGGKLILSAEARLYCRKLANALPIGIIPKPIEGRLAVQVLLCSPQSIQGSRWDIANREKLICDALTKQRIWLDDSQIDWISFARGPAFANGRALVRIDVYHPIAVFHSED